MALWSARALVVSHWYVDSDAVGQSSCELVSSPRSICRRGADLRAQSRDSREGARARPRGICDSGAFARLDEAEKLLKRALVLTDKGLGPVTAKSPWSQQCAFPAGSRGGPLKTTSMRQPTSCSANFLRQYRKRGQIAALALHIDVTSFHLARRHADHQSLRGAARRPQGRPCRGPTARHAGARRRRGSHGAPGFTGHHSWLLAKEALAGHADFCCSPAQRKLLAPVLLIAV